MAASIAARGQRPVAREYDVHLVRAERPGRGHSPVEHEVRTCACQRTVFAARRLTLAEVDHDHGTPSGLGRRAQLHGEGERRSAAAAQPDVVDGVDQVVEGDPGEVAVLLPVRGERRPRAEPGQQRWALVDVRVLADRDRRRGHRASPSACRAVAPTRRIMATPATRATEA